MRIAISGTHCSGKSTLAEDFIAMHPEYAHEPEPFEWLVHVLGEEIGVEPEAEDFYRQLEVSVERLSTYPRESRVVFERSPIDFIAYMFAFQELRRGDAADIHMATILAAQGMRHVDVLVLLPLDDDRISAPESEDMDLRQAMNDHLLELLSADDSGLIVPSTHVIEARGTRDARLRTLERSLVVPKLSTTCRLSACKGLGARPRCCRRPTRS